MEFYFGGHHGEVDFKEGYFIKTGKKISGGAFVIDMNRMSDESGEYENGLISHLKDPDFFDVKLYQTSKLVFTNVIYYDSTHMRINANLTIKDITLPIFFNAEVDFNKKQLTTRFKIDRTLWGITYNNKVKNDAISDAIAFQVTLKL
ncbi:MAG: YceI family protein [Flavobacteriaceae bacterium]|nr:YceI family protein [Flavobacteriaceae bacterium]